MRSVPVLFAASAIGIAAGGMALPATAQRAEVVDRSSLRVCADPDNPPLSMKDGSGFENRIAELFGKQLGIPVSYVWFPNGQGFFRNTLNLRRCDLVMGSPAGYDIAQETIPYYRSAYVLVTRAAEGITATSLADPSIAKLAIGAQSGSPAIDALASAGTLDHLRAYPLTPEGGGVAVAQRMIDDVLARKTDAAVIWGPIGAYFAGLHADTLRVTPLAAGPGRSPFAFEISMAVRFGETKWRGQVDDLIRKNRPAMNAILQDFRVPLLPIDAEAMK